MRAEVQAHENLQADTYVSSGSRWQDFLYFLPRNCRWPVGLMVGVMLFFVAAWCRHVLPLRAHGQEAVAQILDVRHGYRSCSYTYAYLVGGHTYIGSEDTCGAYRAIDGELAKGTHIVITYDPRSPGRSIGGPIGEWYTFGMRLLTIFPLLTGVLIAANFATWRRELLRAEKRGPIQRR